MADEARPIFRGEALRRFVQGQEMSVLPPSIRPRTFVYLWVLLALLVVAGAVVVALADVGSLPVDVDNGVESQPYV